MLAVLMVFSGCAKPPLFHEKECLRAAELSCRNYGEWLKADGVLYIAELGRIYRVTPEATQREVLADHAFSYISQFGLSPDGHFIGYVGFLKTGGFASYIHDIRNRTDFKMPGDGS